MANTRGVRDLSGANNGARSGYRADIDGLRALAVLSVVFYHAEVPLIRGGFTGVDIFFVLSGYLIGGHIAAELGKGVFRFTHFYQRRAKRILPAFFVVVSFVLATGLLLLAPDELMDTGKNALAALGSISNIYFLRYANYFQASSDLNPLLMTWSLGVEEQFYLLLPPLLLLCSRLRKGRLMMVVVGLITAASFIYASIEVFRQPSRAFYLLPSRAWELGAGVLLALAERKGSVFLAWIRSSRVLCPALGLALISAPMFLLRPITPFPGLWALPTVLGTVLLLASGTSAFNRKVLSSSPLVLIGEVSYSWYLWHWPLLAFLRVVSGGPLKLWAAVVAAVVSFGLAVASYYVIEQPFRRSTTPPIRLLVRYGVLGTALALVPLLFWKTHGVPQRYRSTTTFATATRTDECLADYGERGPKDGSRCAPSPSIGPVVALWGDSHAAALAPALRAEVTDRGGNLAEYLKSSCLPLAGYAKSVPGHPSVVEECIEFNQKVLERIQTNAHIRTVVLAGRWEDPFLDDAPEPLLEAHERLLAASEPLAEEKERLVAGLEKNIAALEATGKHVVVIDDVPNFDFDPLYRTRTDAIPTRKMLASWMKESDIPAGRAPASFRDAAARSEEALRLVHAQNQEVPVIDLRSMFCDGNGMCAYMEQGRLLYADPQHLTAAGAFYALRNVRLPN